MELGHKIDTAKDALRFIQAGRATFSLRSIRTGVHFTYKVKQAKDNANLFFVSLLRGADNESDYSYIGFIRDGRWFHGGRKSRASKEASSVIAFGWAWNRLNQGETPELEVYHACKCGACGRKLTTPESIATGLGPECSERLGVARAKLSREPAPATRLPVSAGQEPVALPPANTTPLDSLRANFSA